MHKIWQASAESHADDSEKVKIETGSRISTWFMDCQLKWWNIRLLLKNLAPASPQVFMKTSAPSSQLISSRDERVVWFDAAIFLLRTIKAIMWQSAQTRTCFHSLWIVHVLYNKSINQSIGDFNHIAAYMLNWLQLWNPQQIEQVK